MDSGHSTQSGARVEEDLRRGKDALKNSGLFHDLSVGIKDLMKCLLGCQAVTRALMCRRVC